MCLIDIYLMLRLLIASMSTDLSGVKNIIRYSYKELQAATNDFNRANKIGEGGFGSVYKVIAHCI